MRSGSAPTSPTPQRPTLLLLFVAATGLLAGVLGALLGTRLSVRPATLGEKPPEIETPTAREHDQESAATPNAAVALLGLEQGYFVYADGERRLFLLRFSPQGSEEIGRPETLELVRVFALSNAPLRHPLDPARRSAHGFYLDDLGLERETALERAQFRFSAEVLRKAVDAAADRRIEEAAAAVLRAGDASFLEAQLEGTPFSARRAAALALGRAGFRSAAPVLLELLETSPKDRAEARALLEHLAGRPIADRAAFERWWNRLSPAQRHARVEAPETEPAREPQPDGGH